MLQYVCLALLVAVASAGHVQFQDCGHHEVTKLDINECEGATCIIHKGKELKLAAEFVANQDTAHIKVHLTASVDGLEIPIPGVDKDGCKYVKCPLVKGETRSFNYSLMVPKLLPNIKADVKAEFTGDHGFLGCLKLHGEIAN